MVLNALAVPFLAALPMLHAAPSSVGVGIQPGPVCLPVIAQPGHSYSLGSVHVADTGSGSESISLYAISPVNGLPGKHFPSSWVSPGYPELLWVIGQSSVSLGPGNGTDVPLTLNVPAGAAPGAYAANLAASTAPVSASGLAFGAEAITNLTFTVGPGGNPPSACNPDPAAAPDPEVTSEGKQPVITSLAAPAAKTLPHIPSTLPSWFGWVGVALIILIIWSAKRQKA